ncbi:hypothetical protein [Actinokineospora globicatena]|uniref:hypothetical protein n=1 Tax=Actinokineospora globicatena TaxID=103729 RepID=UPI0020A432A8|nr:hypothetical protein [Actinokineospora globicatena]MCP2303869.1 hypothetical protein [Actinokineospora globicatena]GLW78973.1 hypothetical protein Aglo01_34550 [Actinokineospora globicatena]GLW86616.1 hypothetical protein Aglo02_42550 [Actinokineospora globicatena]
MTPANRTRRVVVLAVVIAVLYAAVFVLLAAYPEAGTPVRIVAYVLMGLGVVVTIVAWRRVARNRTR